MEYINCDEFCCYEFDKLPMETLERVLMRAYMLTFRVRPQCLYRGRRLSHLSPCPRCHQTGCRHWLVGLSLIQNLVMDNEVDVH